MAEGENVSLTLDNFEENIKTYWKEIQSDDSFCDMTLACDGKQILTHRLIISSQSLVIRDILKHNPNSHPLIYLRNFKYQDLQNLLNFIYEGVVNIPDRELSNFLEAAKDLKIIGLSGKNNEGFSVKDTEIEKHDSDNTSPKHKRIKESEENSIDFLSDSLQASEDVIDNSDRLLFQNKESFSVNDNELKEYDDHNKTSMKNKMQAAKDLKIIGLSGKKHKRIKESDNSINENNYKDFLTEFSQSSEDIIDNDNKVEESLKQITGEPFIQNESKNTNDTFKIEKKNLVGGNNFACELCDTQFSENNLKSSLKRHLESVHLGIRYYCNQCDYKTPQKAVLKNHIKSRHGEPTYLCDQCDYKAKLKDLLKRHIESVHIGIVYSCNLCNYKATLKAKLKRHVETIHEGSRYQCDQCNYMSNRKDNLKSHTLKVHKWFS